MQCCGGTRLWSRQMPRQWRRRSWARRFALVVTVVSWIGATQAAAGEVGIPCAPGAYSANGFQPCSLRPPGTYNRFEGAVQCQPCSEGTYAVGPGATAFEVCECRDEALCTTDRCDATTGACTAHDPAPSCEAYAVRVDGVVTQTGGSMPGLFSVGESMTGSWIVDPSELERGGFDTSGSYPNGVVDVRVRVGDGPGAVEGIATHGSLYIESTPPRGSDYLDLLAKPTTAGFTFSNLSFTLDDGDDPAIVSTAIPLTFPVPASFGSLEFHFSVTEGAANASATSTQFSVSVPEPQPGFAALVAFAALRLLSGRAALRNAARSRLRDGRPRAVPATAAACAARGTPR